MMSHHYDPNPPPKPCQCSTGCGLVIERKAGSHNRKYHEQCPSTIAKRKHKAAAYQRMYDRAQRAKNGPRKPPTAAARVSSKLCPECFGLTERRPKHKPCPGCGERYAVEVIRR